MNPYDFVPIEDVENPPKLQKPTLHHKFEGLAGRIVCQLTAETPIFIPKSEPIEPKRFIKRNKVPIIPGSSLKGLFRNLVETVANGCFLLFDGKYERPPVHYEAKLPKGFGKCTSKDELCIACRMFGMLARREVFSGNVSVSDAVTEEGKYSEHAPIYTKALMGPKPRHEIFYLDPKKEYIAGRKFYFHSPQGIHTDQKKTGYNQYICPLNPGSEFTFTVDFTNLKEDELPVLLYALVLEPTMRHKIGLAKPLGLGSVKIEVQKIIQIDYHQRYLAQAEPVELTGKACEEYIARQIEPFTSHIESKTLSALRRIWEWEPKKSTHYVYPDQQWFRKHSQTPIAQTP